MSESVVPLYTTASASIPTPSFTGGPGSEAEPRSRKRSASTTEPSTRGTPERPPRPRYGLFESPRSKRNAASTASTLPQADIMAKASRRHSVGEGAFQPSFVTHDGPPASNTPATVTETSADMEKPPAAPAPSAPLAVASSHAETKESSIADTVIQNTTAPERKGSAASTSSSPFVIAMGSPYNPALVTPVTSIPPAACSITRNQPLKIVPVTSRMGLGGTMASTTPVTSPVSPTNVIGLDFPLRSASTKPQLVESTVPKRKFSLSKKHEEQSSRPETPSHSRSGSASSIRTAIRLPRSRDKEKEAHKMRKDSISMPRPLGSPFGFERSMSVGMEGRGESDREPVEASVYGVGEAI